MTKNEFAEGWKHFCDCIKWDKTFLDGKAIQFMNEGIGKVSETFQQRDDLLEACKWINNIISTACDGGDAWCSIRNRPGASEWANNLKAAIAKCEA